MHFVYPYFLYALFSLAIPVIIHLYNFRKYKKLEFSNISFLKNIQEETQSKSQLKHLLILACRLLVIFFLVLLFAQPYIPNKNTSAVSGQSIVSIYIDNSFSMNATERNGTLLDEAKKKAEEIIKAYGPSDKFQLLTNEFMGKQQRLLSGEEFFEELNHVQICSFSRNFKEILSRQTDALNSQSSNSKTAYIISDFQKNMINNNDAVSDTGIFVHLLPLSSEIKKNVYIDTCYFTSPSRKVNEPEELIVTIKNNGNEKIENNTLKLFIDGQQKALRNFNVEENSNSEVTISFMNSGKGVKSAYLEISDNPITYDDRLYFSYSLNDKFNLLIINGKNASSYLHSLFEKDSIIKLNEKNEDNIDYSELKNNQMIIINEVEKISSGLLIEVKKYFEKGGHLLLIPSSKSDISTFNTFLTELGLDPINSKDSSKQKVNYINYQHPLFQGVFDPSIKKAVNTDLPDVNNHFNFKATSSSKSEILMQLQNGDPFLISKSIQKGRIYILSVSLDIKSGNFAKHALFVPSMYQMVFQSQQTGNLYQKVGKNNFLEINYNNKDDNSLKLTKINGKFELIPEIKNFDGKSIVYFNNEITADGNYQLSSDNKSLAGVSFNYNRTESELNYLGIEELKNIASNTGAKVDVFNNSKKDMTYAIKELKEGHPLWKYCVIFALIFMLAEVLIIRLYK